jgi:flap endonuclease-1
MIQNLTLAKKRKLSNGDFVYISPEVIEYERALGELNVDGDQLICIAILVGTDFNPGGVKGIGAKKALALVREHKYPVAIFEAVQERYGSQDFDWRVIFEMFKKPNVDKVNVRFPKLNIDKIKEILVREHDFSLDRVEKQLEKLVKVKKETSQKRLF